MVEKRIHAYKGTAPYIFISYAHKDSQQVLPIMEQLQKDGYRIWFDEGIEAGSEWADNLARSLKQSSGLIAFLSEDYLDSQNCKDEIEYAKSKSIPTLIIYLNGLKNLPDWFELRHGRTQAIWSGSEKFFDQIYEAEMMQCCREETAGPSQTQLPQPEALPQDAFFRVSLSANDGSLYVCKTDRHGPGKTGQVSVPEEIIREFVGGCKRLIAAVFPGTLPEHVMVRRVSPLDIVPYTPGEVDGDYYCKDSHAIRFKVSFLRGEETEKYDSARFEVDDSKVDLTLFKNGNYIFKSVSDDVELSALGIDEAVLQQAAKEMVQFAARTKNIVVANRFRKVIYSDRSGGFYLDYVFSDDESNN